jgi:hypothetical protein
MNGICVLCEFCVSCSGWQGCCVTAPRLHIPTRCVVCDSELLNPHELSGLCRECKLILRNTRLSKTVDTTGEPA